MKRFSLCPSDIAADTNTSKCLCMFMPYLWMCTCIYVYFGVRVSSLHHLRVLLYSCMFINVHSTSKSASSLVFLSVAMSLESLQRLSKGFGTGDVGDGVGHWFLWVAAVVVNLEQDGEVHEDLQQATCPELHRSLGEQEVACFKGVTAGPHQHHLDTHALCGLVLIIAVELWCAQHCFSEDSQEAQSLHKQRRVQ